MKKNARAKNRRPQAVKGENKEWMRAEQERRRSSVAQPHRNKSKYTRKVKHKEF